VVEEIHRGHPPALRLEEELIHRMVLHRVGEASLDSIEALLRTAVRGMLRHDDGGAAVARWANQAWRRLPAAVAETDTARLLAVGAALRVRSTAPVAQAESLPASLSWLAPSDLATIQIGVEVVRDGIRFIEPIAGRMRLELPSTSPAAVELTWLAGAETRTVVAAVAVGQTVSLEGLHGPITIRTLTGRQYVVEPEFEPGTGVPSVPAGIDPEARAMLAAACVEVASTVRCGGFFAARDVVVTQAPGGAARVLWRGRAIWSGTPDEVDGVGVIRMPTPGDITPIEGADRIRLREGEAWVSWAQGRPVTGTWQNGRFEIDGPEPDLGAPVIARRRLVGMASGYGERPVLDVIGVDTIARAIAPRKVEFVLSYAAEDRGQAEWLRWVLKSAGYDVTHLDREDAVGQTWSSSMSVLLNRADRVIALESPALLASEWLRNMVEGPKLIAVRMIDFDAPGLAADARVDLSGMPREQARSTLLRAIRGLATPGPPIDAGPEPTFSTAAGSSLPDADTAFFGREPELAEVSRRIADRGRVLLTGPPGIGKTRLALEYARAQLDEFDVVWWVRTADDTTRAADLARLAGAAGKRRLIVFDDAPNPQTVVAQADDRVVVTSTSDREWMAYGRPLLLKPVEPATATRLLMDRTGDPDERSATELASRARGLPLALELVAGAAAAERWSLSELLSRFELRGSAEPVAELWGAIVRHSRVPADAMRIISACAFLAADDIPTSLFASGWFADGAFKDDHDRIGGAIIGLQRRALLTVTGDRRISLHPHVQRVIRDRPPAEAELRPTLELVYHEFPEQGADADAWPACERLLAHALTVTQRVIERTTPEDDTAALLVRCARYLRVRGDLHAAAELVGRAVEIARRSVRPDGRAMSQALTELGLLRLERGEARQAVSALEEARKLAQETYPTGDPEHARIAGFLGTALHRQGDLSEPLILLDTAVQRFDPDEYLLPQFLAERGAVLRDMGAFAEARESIERARQIAAKQRRQSHPQAASILVALASVQRVTGEVDAALRHAEEAVRTLEAIYGRNHLAVADALAEMSLSFRYADRFDDAHVASEDALRILEDVLGPDSPRLTATRTLLAGADTA
jgi:tetratricopeptide (TPR) repeat protein